MWAATCARRPRSCSGKGGVEVTLRDVDADPELFRLYDFRVPVILLDGRVVAEGRIDSNALVKLRP